MAVAASAWAKGLPDLRPILDDVAMDVAEERGFLFTTLTRTLRPFWICLHRPQEDGPRAAMLDSGMYYERAKTLMMEELFDSERPGVFVDVGGNVGWYSLLAAAHGRHTVTFEPDPVNARLFTLSTHINGFDDLVSLQQMGAGAVDGELKSTPGSDEPHDIAHHHGHAAGEYHKSETIQVRPVDAVLTALGGAKVVAIKIDVKGYEDQALKGMLHLLEAQCPPLWVEFDRADAVNQRRDYFRVLAKVLRLGYRPVKHVSGAPTSSPANLYSVDAVRAWFPHISGRDFLLDCVAPRLAEP